MTGTIAIVLKGYPRLSETFIAQEIHALERRGFALRIYSLRHPTDTSVHPVHREIRAPAAYLPEYLGDEPRRVLAGWRRARRLPGYQRARRAFLRDLARDPTTNRLRRFGQACVLAAELPGGVDRLYAHFLHTPASVARYGALITGLPWSASAHAKDIWTTPDWELRDKLGEAEWVTTCTASGRDRLAALAPAPERVALNYHGLDFARARSRRRATRTCSRPSPSFPRPCIGAWCTSAAASGARPCVPRHCASAWTRASTGAAPCPSSRSWPSTVRPTSSCSPAASPATATATAYPTC
jgi:hypothetical protein